MLTYFFLTSGLFLGWSLGSNDAANIFGTAVASRMIKFRTAAIVASIFVVLGAVMQGSGATQTLSELGSIDTLGGAFAVALCSAIVITTMTKYGLPVSTGQAIVGAIMGWCYFTSNPVEYSVLGKIIGSWVVGPILGAIFSALLYLLVRKFIRTSSLHLIKMEVVIRISLLVVGAFGAYSLGANNIANVMGVFVKSISFTAHIGDLTIDSVSILFLLGGFAISIGIFTYSKRVMETVGEGILSLTPESAIVVVLSQALVLFVFSSSSLSHLVASTGLPAIPLVPISSTQVVVGSVFGIGLIKGMQELKLKTLSNIMLGWILTPILSGAFTFFSLFFIKNIFGIKVSNNSETVLHVNEPMQTNLYVPFDINSALISLLLIVLASISIYFVISHVRNKEKNAEKEHRFIEQMQYSDFQKALSDMEVNTIQLENTSLTSRLEEKRNELITYSLNIGEQRQYLEAISGALNKALEADQLDDKDRIIKEQLIGIKQKMSFTNEVDKLYQQAEQVHKHFIENLKQHYPDLSNQDKRLLVLLRIGLSSKEIAPLLNISVKSVEISRYRLRKKLNIEKNINLVDFSKTM